MPSRRRETNRPALRTLAEILKYMKFYPVEIKELKGAQLDELEYIVHNRYRRLARECHPDLGGDEESFKRLNYAYSRFLKIKKYHHERNYLDVYNSGLKRVSLY